MKTSVKILLVVIFIGTILVVDKIHNNYVDNRLNIKNDNSINININNINSDLDSIQMKKERLERTNNDLYSELITYYHEHKKLKESIKILRFEKRKLNTKLDSTNTKNNKNDMISHINDSLKSKDEADNLK